MHDATRPALVVVAHGSRDPRHAATVAALCARVRALRPGLHVEAAYLDFDAPSVPRLLERLHAAGVREVVALPLLLSRAFHAKSDIPAVLHEATSRLPRLHVRQAEVLGPHPLLVRALERRLREAGLGPEPGRTGRTGNRAGGRRPTGIVLASAGSSDPEAIAVIAQTAREWRRTAGWCAVRPAFASASSPRTEDAVRGLRADGVAHVAVAPYVIAPGRLPDRIRDGALEARADVLAPVLGDAPEMAELLALRYDESAARGPLALSA
ncbi:sirohydrochlorin ferrochelatase [Streptomyces sp. Amel2xB2]|uniref:sirohydrochlorin chelatase n=1 Tax=Streptomyces sp. Amel2xB2 TaxID=1305829 RepID=UPI000DB9ED67|nr:sirohydrochlorin chelatase [Streptomyces sp. Amel2xB2]RAJ55727.1 sirohydrochlorin ferrochelatase [Streptomyces sp. Amel2xB2]